MTDTRPWSEDQDHLLASLLDEIVPSSADGRVTAAGALGVAEFLAGKASADPELAASLRAVLSHAAALAEAGGASFDDLDAAGRIAVVEALEREVPDAFTALLWHTYMGYYSRADVRPQFGLSPKPRRSRRATSCPKTTPMNSRICWPRCAGGAAAIARPERGRCPV